MLLLFITYGLYLVSTKTFASFSEKPICNYFLLIHTSQTIMLTKVRNKKGEHPTTTHLHSFLLLRNPMSVHPAHRKLGLLQGSSLNFKQGQNNKTYSYAAYASMQAHHKDSTSLRLKS